MLYNFSSFILTAMVVQNVFKVLRKLITNGLIFLWKLTQVLGKPSLKFRGGLDQLGPTVLVD